MIESLRDAVQAYADAHADASGFAATPVEGLTLMRVRAPTGLIKVIYRPLVCLVLQGTKEVTVAATTYRFAAGQSALVSADVPAVSRIVRASPAAPYAAVAVDLDPALFREVSTQLGLRLEPGSEPPDVSVGDTDAAVAECALRLVRLLDRPEAIPVLHAALVRELHYWLLAGRHGAVVRRLAGADGSARGVARATALLRAEFDRPVAGERLAAAAGMSPSGFYQHFRAVTSLSPLQFQKQLRLIEARRLMVNDALTAGQAAFRVGYESVSQFSREYGRMFGLPPARDRSESRAA